MSGFLYQIEAKQELLKQHYAEVQKVKKTPLVLVSSEPASIPGGDSAPATTPISEKLIAVSLPADVHAQAEALMKALDFKGSKREFVRDVLRAAFKTLSLSA